MLIIVFFREEMDLENYVFYEKFVYGIVDAMTISHQFLILSKLKKKTSMTQKSLS